MGWGLMRANSFPMKSSPLRGGGTRPLASWARDGGVSLCPENTRISASLPESVTPLRPPRGGHLPSKGRICEIPTRRSASQGFTLIELLVALTVFSLLAAAGVGLLSVSVKSQELVKSTTDQTAAIGRVASVLGQDFGQVVPRAWRDSGGAEQVAFTGTTGSASGDVMSFIRISAQTGVQRIILRRDANSLSRVTYDHPDGDSESRQTVLVDDLSTLRLRYRSRGAWSDIWAPTRSDALPEAVEMLVSRTGQPEIRYVFAAGARAR
jgi:general secretion pathway protein J